MTYKKALKQDIEIFKNTVKIHEKYILKKLSDLLETAEVRRIDNENYELTELECLENGLNVQFGWAGGDWQEPVLFAIYQTSIGLRLVTPLDGNSFNTKFMIPWGEDPNELSEDLEISDEDQEYAEDEEQFKNDSNFRKAEDYDMDLVRKWLISNIELEEDTRHMVSEENLPIGGLFRETTGRLLLYCGQVIGNEIVYEGSATSYLRRKDLLDISLSEFKSKLLFLEINKEFYIRKLKLKINNLADLIKQLQSELSSSKDSYTYWSVDSANGGFDRYDFAAGRLSKKYIILYNTECLEQLKIFDLPFEPSKLLADVIESFQYSYNYFYTKDLSEKYGEDYKKVYCVGKSDFKGMTNLRLYDAVELAMPDNWKDRIFGRYFDIQEKEEARRKQANEFWENKEYDKARELGAEITVNGSGSSFRFTSILE